MAMTSTAALRYPVDRIATVMETARIGEIAVRTETLSALRAKWPLLNHRQRHQVSSANLVGHRLQRQECGQPSSRVLNNFGRLC